jgi:TetR/AcrR family transcriptional repressor of nem operon
MVREHLSEQFGAWDKSFELLARFVLNSWEGALLRMRAEKSDAPLLEFKEIIFGKVLVK